MAVSSSTVEGAGWCMRTIFFSLCQTGSIGFRSGEFGG